LRGEKKLPQEYEPTLKSKSAQKKVPLALDLLQTNGDCEASFDGSVMMTSAGPLFVKSLKNAAIN